MVARYRAAPCGRPVEHNGIDFKVNISPFSNSRGRCEKSPAGCRRFAETWPSSADCKINPKNASLPMFNDLELLFLYATAFNFEIGERPIRRIAA